MSDLTLDAELEQRAVLLISFVQHEALDRSSHVADPASPSRGHECDSTCCDAECCQRSDDSDLWKIVVTLEEILLV